jgi:hypothetical protein
VYYIPALRNSTARSTAQHNIRTAYAISTAPHVLVDGGFAPLRRRDDDVDVVVLEELFSDDQGGVTQDLVYELAVAFSEGVRRVGWRGWRGLWVGAQDGMKWMDGLKR